MIRSPGSIQLELIDVSFHVGCGQSTSCADIPVGTNETNVMNDNSQNTNLRWRW
jgi:hypothetical protein